MIAIAGGLLAALGILAGALLGAAAFGLAAAGPSLWILFPLLTLVGWFLLVVSDVDPLRGTPTRVVASALLLLALLAAVGLVGGGAGLLAIQGIANCPRCARTLSTTTDPWATVIDQTDGLMAALSKSSHSATGPVASAIAWIR